MINCLTLLFSFLLMLPVFASSKMATQSMGISLNTANSDSDLEDTDKKRLLTFRPNVSSGFGLTLEMEHFGFSYFFTGKQAQSVKHEKSRYRDLRFNYHLFSFDFRLNYQNYRGAMVDAGGLSTFYKDYEVKSLNGRFHYYSSPDHLNYIRDGKKLVQKVSKNVGFSHSGSWFVGLNTDNRSIDLPVVLEAQHLALITDKDVRYKTRFSAFSWGPMVGYDGMVFLGPIFMRGKLAFGPAFQTGGGTVEQLELALNSGFSFYANHLLSFGVDVYSIGFKDDNQRISNNNAQVLLSYTYVFN